MEPAAAHQFGHLFSWRHPAAAAASAASAASMELSHAAAASYRYNHNMMEYYTCKRLIDSG